MPLSRAEVTNGLGDEPGGSEDEGEYEDDRVTKKKMHNDMFAAAMGGGYATIPYPIDHH